MDDNFSSRVKDVISYSKEEALRLGHNQIGTEHLLLGMLRDGGGKAISILNSIEVNLDELRKKLFSEYPIFASLDEVKSNTWVKSSKFTKNCLKVDLKNIWSDHYLTNPIARSSHIMATLSKNNKQMSNKEVKN